MIWALLAACGAPRVAADLGQDVTVVDPARGMCLSEKLDRWDPDHEDAQIAAMQAIGVREIRQDLRWAYVEPTPGAWNWATEDLAIDGAVGAGFEIIAMLGYGNPWATEVAGADEMFPPDDPADFAAFAGAAAARYGDRVDRYEIWNEPNAGYRFWQTDPPSISGDPVAYAALALAAADAIHAADPGAEVQIGSVFFHEQLIMGGVEFLVSTMAAEPRLAEAADAVSFHPYPLYPPTAPPEADADGQIDIEAMTAQVRDATGGLPAVVTELGWPSWGDVTREQQADYTVRAIALLHAAGVRDACVYTLDDGDTPDTNPERAFGLYEMGPGAIKPSGVAYGALAAALAEVDTSVGRVDLALGWPTDARAVRYPRRDGGALTVAWSVGDPLDVVIPHLEGSERCARVNDIVVDVPYDGVPLHLTGTPILLAQGDCP